MKNKIFTNTDENKFAREVLPEGRGSGLFLVKGSIKLDDTHVSSFDETFLVIRSVGGSDSAYDHSLVICSQGAFFDDVKVWSKDQITARKPIILTPETTEVDEETYQKLLSDDVDVIFKDTCILHLENIDRSDTEIINLYFNGRNIGVGSADEVVFFSYTVSVTKSSPHNVSSKEETNNLQNILDSSDYLNKSILSPVLQEIDLSGTDEERKAKLTQFEADWKELTGARDLKGARFVGNTLVDGNEITGVLTYNVPNGAYSGICRSERGENFIIEVSIDALIITPLFFHLEPVPLTDTTSTNKTQLDLFLSKVPNAQVMHVTYKDVYAGTLHKINGSWYGVLVGESNTLAGQLSIKLQADGTIVEGTA